MGFLSPFDFWCDGSFSRDFKEVNRFKQYDLKDGSKMIVVDTLGIRKEDLSITAENNSIKISGKTENKDLGMVSSVNYELSDRSAKTIKSIDYKVADGYTYIHIIYKDKENKIKINCISN